MPHVPGNMVPPPPAASLQESERTTARVSTDVFGLAWADGLTLRQDRQAPKANAHWARDGVTTNEPGAVSSLACTESDETSRVPDDDVP